MKKLVASLLIFLSVTPSFADVKISQLPLNSAADVGANDSFPYVNSVASETERLTLDDLVNLPAMVATYAPLNNPPFTGQVILPDGTVALPSLTFLSEESTGVYKPSTGTLGVAITGTEVAAFSAFTESLYSYGQTAGGPIVHFYGIGGTQASPTNTASGNGIGTLGYRGRANGALTTASSASVQAFALNNWTASDWSAYLTLGTTPSGSTGRVERMRINASGNVSIANTNDTYALDVTGTVNSTNINNPIFNTQTGQLNLSYGADSNATGALRVVPAWTTAAGANSQTAARIVGQNTFDGAMTASIFGADFATQRTIVNDQTDTGSVLGGRATVTFTVPTGKTYTNSAGEVDEFRLNSVSAVSGTLAIADLRKLNILADSTATGTRKTGVFVGAMSGATDNAMVADNTSYTGSWVFDITSTNASLLSGALGVGVAPSTNHVLDASLGTANSALTVMTSTDTAAISDGSGHNQVAFQAGVSSAITSSGTTSTFVGGRFQFLATVATGLSDTGSWQAVQATGSRQGGSGDVGTLSEIDGVIVQYGNISTGSAAVTSTAKGIDIKPQWQTGTVSAGFGLYFESPGTGGTAPSTYYDIYAPDSSASNVIAGPLTLANIVDTGSALNIKDSSDTSKVITFSTGSATTSTTLTLINNQTSSRSLNFPNISGTDTLAVLGLGQTFSGADTFSNASFTLSSLTSSASALDALCWNASGGAVTHNSAGALCSASLEELKDIEGTISPDDALKETMALKPIWAKFKDSITTTSDHRLQPMFGAHQVESVDPRLAEYDSEGALHSVRYTGIPALNTAAIQALQGEILELKSEIKNLRTEFDRETTQ